MYSLEVENLRVAYNSHIALEDVSFKSKHPSILTIIGPNGAGKSTLVKAALGLVDFEGKIKVLGIDVKSHVNEVRRISGYVPQKEHIEYSIPVKVKDVVLMGLLAKRAPPRVVTKRDILRAREALRMVNAENLWDRRFTDLSGGQQQRVMIARALVSNPKILFLDEPFSGVDSTTQLTLIRFLYELRIKHGVSIVLVVHDVNHIMECIDEILILNRRLIAHGRPDEVISEEILEKAYGKGVKVIRHGGICYPITGDFHA